MSVKKEIQMAKLRHCASGLLAAGNGAWSRHASEIFIAGRKGFTVDADNAPLMAEYLEAVSPEKILDMLGAMANMSRALEELRAENGKLARKVDTLSGLADFSDEADATIVSERLAGIVTEVIKQPAFARQLRNVLVGAKKRKSGKPRTASQPVKQTPAVVPDNLAYRYTAVSAEELAELSQLRVRETVWPRQADKVTGCAACQNRSWVTHKCVAGLGWVKLKVAQPCSLCENG